MLYYLISIIHHLIFIFNGKPFFLHRDQAKFSRLMSNSVDKIPRRVRAIGAVFQRNKDNKFYRNSFITKGMHRYFYHTPSCKQMKGKNTTCFFHISYEITIYI